MGSQQNPHYNNWGWWEGWGRKPREPPVDEHWSSTLCVSKTLQWLGTLWTLPGAGYGVAVHLLAGNSAPHVQPVVNKQTNVKIHFRRIQMIRTAYYLSLCLCLQASEQGFSNIQPAEKKRKTMQNFKSNLIFSPTTVQIRGYIKRLLFVLGLFVF